MKVVYTLINVRDKHRLVPPGQAWKWIHEIESFRQVEVVFEYVKRKIRYSRLRLANLYISESSTCANLIRPVHFQYKGPIVYDDSIHVNRIIHEHLDNTDDKDAGDFLTSFPTLKASNHEKPNHP